MQRYVKVDTTPLYKASSGNAAAGHLLWGDAVTVEGSGSRLAAKVRGLTGFVAKSDLGEEPLLELYFIDVGQGDGTLIVTPDRRTILIDGGNRRSKQPAKRNAADFVDWKFVKDYRRKAVNLDVLIASHCDADHFGGLWDLVNPAETAELDATSVTVETAYHAGVSWWKEGEGRTLGKVVKKDGQDYLVDILESRDEIPKLAGEWGKFFADLDATKKKGGGRTKLTRLSAATHDYVPDFAPQNGDVAIRVLGPMETRIQGGPAIPSFGSASQSTNGNSLLLRLDYGRARILLTGDLNTASQRAILDHFQGQRQELECDVAKACHHGSDDVSYEFLQTMRAGATIISSGDAETYGHPRPSIVAASAASGFHRVENDKIVTPLVYSTELARSYNLLELPKTTVQLGDGSTLTAAKLRASKVTFEVKNTKRTRSATDVFIVAGLTYGLINVRTDGRKILCAALNEGNMTWHIKSFPARF